MGREYYDGRDNYVIYDEETSYGTGATPAISNNFGMVQGVSFNMNQNLIRTQGLGDGLDAQNVNLGVFDVSGTIDSRPVDFTYLQYGVGYRVGAGSTASHYRLIENGTLGYSGTTLSTIAIEVGAKGSGNNQEKTISGIAFNTWTLSGAIGDQLTSSVDFTGEIVTRGTTIETYAALSERPFVFNGGGITWGSSDKLSVEDFSVTCALNPVFPREVATRFVKQPSYGVRRYDWTFTMKMNFDDTASVMSTTEFLSEFFQAANTPLDNGVITGDALEIDINEGSASGDQNLLIQLENSFINDWVENPTLEGGPVSVTVNGFSLAGKDDGGGLKEPIEWWTIT
jgi:hypothetical protein